MQIFLGVGYFRPVHMASGVSNEDEVTTCCKGERGGFSSFEVGLLEAYLKVVTDIQQRIQNLLEARVQKLEVTHL